jgi:hypothetical protein
MAARKRGKPAPPIYPREPIPDGELRGVDGRKLKRGDVVRNPERYSETLKATVPDSVGRIVDIYRRNGQEVVEVVLDSIHCAANSAMFLASRVKRSQARIRTEEDAMPDKERNR